jgi:hypothetical protein
LLYLPNRCAIVFKVDIDIENYQGHNQENNHQEQMQIVNNHKSDKNESESGKAE